MCNFSIKDRSIVIAKLRYGGCCFLFALALFLVLMCLLFVFLLRFNCHLHNAVSNKDQMYEQ